MMKTTCSPAASLNSSIAEKAGHHRGIAGLGKASFRKAASRDVESLGYPEAMAWGSQEQTQFGQKTLQDFWLRIVKIPKTGEDALR
jgi:hypothetical protein